MDDEEAAAAAGEKEENVSVELKFGNEQNKNHDQVVQAQEEQMMNSDLARVSSFSKNNEIRRRTLLRQKSLHFHGAMHPSSSKQFPILILEEKNIAGKGNLIKAGVEQTFSLISRDELIKLIRSAPEGSGKRFDISSRDIHTLDPSVSLHGPSFFVRKNCILVNLDPIKAILVSNRMYVLLPSSEDVSVNSPKENGSFSFVSKSSHELTSKVSMMKIRGRVTGNMSLPTKKSENALLYQEKSGIIDLATKNNNLPIPIDYGGHLYDTFAYDLRTRLIDIGNAQDRSTFELCCLEVLLITYCDEINHHYEDLLPAIHETIENVLNSKGKRGGDGANLDRIRVCRGACSRLYERIKEGISAFDELLQDPETMSQMVLSVSEARRSSALRRTSNQGRNSLKLNDHSSYEEVESLVDSYLQAIETSLGKVSLLRQELEALNDIALMRLDQARNTLLRIELIFSAVTSSAAVGALVAGVFGMNLNSYVQESDLWFWGVATGLFVFVFCSSTGVIGYLYFNGFLSNA